MWPSGAQVTVGADGFPTPAPQGRSAGQAGDQSPTKGMYVL